MARRPRRRRKGRAARDDGFRRPAPGLLGAIPVATLDLHGETAASAERRVADFLATQSRLHPGRVVHLVTGSGLGSPAGPVLRGRVGEILEGHLSRFVSEHRMDLHRGGWLVRLS